MGGMNEARLAIDQMVKRGLLPPPVSVDDAMLWRFFAVVRPAIILHLRCLAKKS